MSFLRIISLCDNEGLLSESELLRELSNIIQEFPDAALEVHVFTGMTPVHYAARERSAAFIQLLCADDPELAKRTTNKGELPFHIACQSANIDVVKYLYRLHPGCINSVLSKTEEGPLHLLLNRDEHRNLRDVKATCKFLVQRNSEGLFKVDAKGNLPLHYAAEFQDIGCAIYVYNAHPGAILVRNNKHELPVQCAFRWEGRGELGGRYQSKPNLDFFTCQTSIFLFNEVRVESVHRHLWRWRRPTPWNDRTTFGTIKLLVQLNPSCLHFAYDSRSEGPVTVRMTPLLIACQRCDKNVVEYIIDTDSSTLTFTTSDGNTALHIACLVSNYDVICLLLSRSAFGISQKNDDGKLPIELLASSHQVDDDDEDHDSNEHHNRDEDRGVDERVVRRHLFISGSHEIAAAADSDDDDDGLRKDDCDDGEKESRYVSALYHVLRAWPDICTSHYH